MPADLTPLSLSKPLISILSLRERRIIVFLS